MYSSIVLVLFRSCIVDLTDFAAEVVVEVAMVEETVAEIITEMEVLAQIGTIMVETVHTHTKNFSSELFMCTKNCGLRDLIIVPFPGVVLEMETKR